MAKKKELFDDLFMIFMLIAIGYFAYRSITLSNSPNLFKELQDTWLVFMTLSSSDFLVLNTIYLMSKKGAQRRVTARSPKAGAITKRILGFSARALVPLTLTIALTVLMTIYFFIVFIASAFLLTLSKSLMLYEIFITTVLMYFVVMYYGIEVWHHKSVRQYRKSAVFTTEGLAS